MGSIAARKRGDHDPATRLDAAHPRPQRWPLDRAAARRFRDRVRAGIGGASQSGHSLALHVGGVPVLCGAWHMHLGRPPALVLMTLGEAGAELWGQGL